MRLEINDNDSQVLFTGILNYLNFIMSLNEQKTQSILIF